MFCVLYAYGIRPDTGQVGLWRGCVMSRTILVGVLGVESGARRPLPSLPRSQQARRRAAHSLGRALYRNSAPFMVPPPLRLF